MITMRYIIYLAKSGLKVLSLYYKKTTGITTIMSKTTNEKLTLAIALIAVGISIFTYFDSQKNDNYNRYAEASNVVPSFSSPNVNSFGEPVINFRLFESTRAIYPAPLDVYNWQLFINNNLTPPLNAQALKYPSLEVESNNPVMVSLVISDNVSSPKSTTSMSEKEIVITIPNSLLVNGVNTIKLFMPYTDIMMGDKRTVVEFKINYNKESSVLKIMYSSRLLIPELCNKNIYPGWAFNSSDLDKLPKNETNVTIVSLKKNTFNTVLTEYQCMGRSDRIESQSFLDALYYNYLFDKSQNGYNYNPKIGERVISDTSLDTK